MEQHIKVKKQLQDKCLEYVEQRIATARGAMEAAQNAANEEAKSSAGDKYETTRAMMQIERDRHAAQLAEALKLQNDLNQLNCEKIYDKAQAGSVVITNHSRFFLAISVGKLNLDSTEYMAVSLASPIGALLNQRRVGDSVQWQGKTIQIMDVF